LGREWWGKIAVVPGLENHHLQAGARRFTTPFIYGVVNFKKVKIKKVKSKVNNYQ